MHIFHETNENSPDPQAEGISLCIGSDVAAFSLFN